MFTIGCDPEVFLKKEGEFVSACGLIPGTKSSPHRVDNGAVQLDGMAAEFNTDPAESEEEFLYNVSNVLEQLQAIVPEHELSFSPVANFGTEYIASQPDEAKELGCDPDYNAYTGGENPSPDEAQPFRTGAGHVHIGWTEGADLDDPNHIEMCRMAVKQMDLYLGLPSLLWDDDVQRREMYGKAGAYRVKPYGVEYRTLSNAWLKSPELRSLVYKNAVKGMEALAKGDRGFEKFPLEESINVAGFDPTDVLKEEGIDYVG